MGYLQDMNHIKEMSYKNLDLDQIFEVKYFDETDALDNESKRILNDRIKEVKIQFQF